MTPTRVTAAQAAGAPSWTRTPIGTGLGVPRRGGSRAPDERSLGASRCLSSPRAWARRGREAQLSEARPGAPTGRSPRPARRARTMARSPTPARRRPSKTPLKRPARTHLRRRLRATQRGPAGCGQRDGRAHSLAALSAPAAPPAAPAPPPATTPDAAPLPGPRAGRGRGPGRGWRAQAQSLRTCPALGWAQRTAGWA